MILNKQMLWGSILTLAYYGFVIISIIVMGVIVNPAYRLFSVLMLVLDSLIMGILFRAFIAKWLVKPRYFYLSSITLIVLGVMFAFVLYPFSFDVQTKRTFLLAIGFLPVGVVSLTLFIIGAVKKPQWKY